MINEPDKYRESYILKLVSHLSLCFEAEDKREDDSDVMTSIARTIDRMDSALDVGARERLENIDKMDIHFERVEVDVLAHEDGYLIVDTDKID